MTELGCLTPGLLDWRLWIIEAPMALLSLPAGSNLSWSSEMGNVVCLGCWFHSFVDNRTMSSIACFLFCPITMHSEVCFVFNCRFLEPKTFFFFPFSFSYVTHRFSSYCPLDLRLNSFRKYWRINQQSTSNRISDSMNLSLSKLREIVKDREARCAEIQGVCKESDTTETLNHSNSDQKSVLNRTSVFQLTNQKITEDQQWLLSNI